tara:strand:- start:1597 stop:3108 length:1512 start_codon:yes stop_codon:yes gene_type:complete
MQQHRIDWPSFIACTAILLLVCIPLALLADAAVPLLERVYDLISRELGFLYISASVAVVAFLVWLGASRFGSVRLGPSDEPPEFGTLSWIAMLFCAGVGAGLMYWCATEWAYYFDAPPFGAEPRSAEAAEWASTYGMFHWGFTAWAFYCLPAIAIAYPYYSRRLDFMRFSLSCNWFLRGREQGAAARFIDFLFMIALIGGAATSLGFSAPMIAACIAWLFDIESGFGLQLGVIAMSAALFAASAWLGLQKGIRRLSDINLVLAYGLLLFILLVGPSVFLLKTSLNSVGVLLQNFARMNFWTDPFSNSGFVESWTVFYWAWWIAFAPYVGLFVARISRGRSIRQVIFGMLGFGSLGSWLYYMVLGNYALFLELGGQLDFTGIMARLDGSAAIVATLETLPLAPFVIALFALVAIIFSATTYDSASYTLAATATRHLQAGEDPDRWHRVFWAFSLGLLPVALMYIGGGLRSIQVALLIVSLPILLVGVAMSIALVRNLRADYPVA